MAEFGTNEPTAAQATSGVLQFLPFFLNPKDAAEFILLEQGLRGPADRHAGGR